MGPARFGVHLDPPRVSPRAVAVAVSVRCSREELDLGIVRRHRHLLLFALRRQHPIEWITVLLLPGTGPFGMSEADRQQLEPLIQRTKSRAMAAAISNWSRGTYPGSSGTASDLCALT